MGKAFTAALLLFVAGAVVAQEIDTECGECDRSACPTVEESCPGGLMLDACGCCHVCARGLGQRCENASSDDAPSNDYGTCGEFLVCRTRTDVRATNEASCECVDQGAVCGSDGITYTTLCHLLQVSAEKPDIFVKERSPCKSEPKIKSRPEDKVREIGNILVLDCEAVGYPIPVITWELNKADGSTFKLPGDDPSFAVQIRGGPEQYMVTGWVQIMRITKEALGIYTCIATNSLGEARASAKVVTKEAGEMENLMNNI